MTLQQWMMEEDDTSLDVPTIIVSDYMLSHNKVILKVKKIEMI